MDLQNFSKIQGAAAQVNVPTATITGKFVDNGNVVADFTGENALQFPAVLSTITQENYQEILDTVAQRLLEMKAGL